MNKKTLIQLILTILIIIIILIIHKKFFTKKVVSNNFNPKDKIELNSNNNSIKNISYRTKDLENREYVINAEYGFINKDRPDEILMKNVKANIKLADNSMVKIYADQAIYNNNTYDTEFQNNVKLEYEEHFLSSDHLNIYFQSNILEAFNNLSYTNSKIKMNADKVEINMITKNSKIFNYSNSNKKVKIETNN